MAKTFQLLDDFDGTPAADTIRFSFDGERYEIDLSADHIATFCAALAPFIEKARVIGKKKAAAATTEEIRIWARSQGMTVSDRGRISGEVKAAYEAATNGDLISV